MTSNSEEIGAAGCSMDEEERRREEIKGSPHEVVESNTAVGYHCLTERRSIGPQRILGHDRRGGESARSRTEREVWWW